ncbi:MAG: hypothetical protein LUD02_13260 [Tannerellaceae bacterium]|nr:hypothetical protein [Tannerellaceae bacterium]
MNLVSRGTQIVSLNDSLYLFSAMQGTLLVNIRELISSTYQGGSPIRFARLEYTDEKGIHNLDINTHKIALPDHFHEFIIHAGTTIFTPNNQISYKIAEVNPEWSEWQKNGKISFMQLREGTYHIHIRKYVVKGPFPKTILTIHIPPPPGIIRYGHG